MIAPNGDNVTLECSASATIVESENETKNSSDVEENNPSKESFLSLQADTGTEQINKNKNKMTVTWKRGQNVSSFLGLPHWVNRINYRKI